MLQYCQRLRRKNNGFKKKNKYKKLAPTNNYTVDNVFRGVGFKVGQ